MELARYRDHLEQLVLERTTALKESEEAAAQVPRKRRKPPPRSRVIFLPV